MQNQTKPEPLGASMAKLVLVAIVIVSLGAALEVLGYVLTKPKPAVQNPPAIEKVDETADWQTYRNEKYGFELQYPGVLVLSENNYYKSGDDQVLLQFTNVNSEIPFITISRFEIGENQTFKDIILNPDNGWLIPIGDSPDFSKFKILKIGDNSYYCRYFCTSIGGPDEQGTTTCDFVYLYWLVKDQSVFEFVLSDTLVTDIKKPNLENYENPPSHLELKKILSTFKFIDINKEK